MESRVEALEKVPEDLRMQLGGMDDHQRTQFAESRQLLAAMAGSLNGESSATRFNNHTETTGETNVVTLLALQQTMELLYFDGSDVLSWIARANQYFLVHNKPVDRRVQVALVALTGPAMSWVQILLRRSPLITWDDFTGELQARFGTSSALNSYEALRAVSQEGTPEEYIATFEGWLAQLQKLTDQQALGFFSGGLRLGMRAQIRDSNLTTYADALKLAKRIEFFEVPSPTITSRSSSLPQSRAPSWGRQAAALPSRPLQQPGSGVTVQNPRPFRSISNEEYRKHRAAGTCFKCGLKFGPMHRCPPKTLQVLVGEDEAEAEAEAEDKSPDAEEGNDEAEHDSIFQQLQLSELTSNGLDSFQTMKMIGYVGEK